MTASRACGPHPTLPRPHALPRLPRARATTAGKLGASLDRLAAFAEGS